ncbi:unnamed protein product [Cyprideis torosa]|uniref:Uncharacterized protein n=1 Tax=Cyprideis torosa TaxID=163714 RepID=A0A7R8WJC2_9CRUS|nr:unnamed protein product [Cyprideis torosa]CAG0898991.1 unnamed protein product [Cyprideis torosa]
MEPPSLNLVSDGRRNEDGSGEDEDNAGNEPRSVLVDGSPNGGTLIKQESVISHHSEDSYDSQMTVTPELSGMVQSPRDGGTPKPKGEGDEAFQRYLSTLNLEEKMELALESLRNKTLSLYKASATYGVASTSLWVRARRAGIDSMKKEGSKSYSEDNLNLALEALRQGKISANRASKEFGIPGSTLYKMAKKEGIKLASPFNLTPPNWSEEDLRKAFDAVKNGMSVLKAASEHGIPSGTLYGKCRREGIELRGKESSQWNQGVLAEALEAVRVGEMSINQASVRVRGVLAEALEAVRVGEMSINQASVRVRGVLAEALEAVRVGEMSINQASVRVRGVLAEALEAVRVGEMSINQASVRYNLPYSTLYNRFRKVALQEENEELNPKLEPA